MQCGCKSTEHSKSSPHKGNLQRDSLHSCFAGPRSKGHWVDGAWQLHGSIPVPFLATEATSTASIEVRISLRWPFHAQVIWYAPGYGCQKSSYTGVLVLLCCLEITIKCWRMTAFTDILIKFQICNHLVLTWSAIQPWIWEKFYNNYYNNNNNNVGTNDQWVGQAQDTSASHPSAFPPQTH